MLRYEILCEVRGGMNIVEGRKRLSSRAQWILALECEFLVLCQFLNFNEKGA